MGDPAHCGELAADENLAIRLHHQAAHIRIRVRVETGVQRAIRIESRDAVACHSAHCGERTPYQDPAIRLQGGAGHLTIHQRIKTRFNISWHRKGRINRAVNQRGNQ